MKSIKEKLNTKITDEDAKKLVSKIFAYVLFTFPLIPEVIGFGVYSLKNTLFNAWTIIISIIMLLLSYKDKVKLNIYEKILGIYLILVVLSCFLSRYGLTSTILGINGRGEGLITILSYVITFIIFSRNYKQMKGILKYGIIVATIVSIYGILQVLLPNGTNLYIIPDITGNIAKGTMKNQNMFSSYLCLFFPMICYYYINSKNKLSIIPACLMFVSLIFSKTLGGYLTCLGMYSIISIYSIVISKDKKKIILKIILLTLLFIMLYFGINAIKHDIYSSEFKMTTEEVHKLANNDESFGTGRMQIWQKGISIIKNNPMFGVGPDNMAYELECNMDKYKIFKDKDILAKYRIDKAHLEYMQIAVTTGIPSMICIIIFQLLVVAGMLKKVVGSKENEVYAMVLISITSYIIQSFANISVVQVAPIFWAMLGVGTSIILDKDEVN